MIVTEAVRELYRAHWGEPKRQAHFEIDGLEVEVFKWEADATPEGVVLYATIGASARPMADHDPNHRVEFFVGLVPERDEVASALAALGLYSEREAVAVDHGHTVPAEGPLWSGTAMQTFLILRPLHDFLPALKLPGGLHVEFLQAVPIFETERSFKNEHGVEALLRQWQESGAQFWNADRAPAFS